MATRESRHTVSGIVIVALIAGTLLAGGVASAADEIVLGAAISQTGKYAREGKFYEHTRLGRAIRATSEELRAARLTGIPVAHIYAVTFGLGAALAGAAGGLWGMLFSRSRR